MDNIYIRLVAFPTQTVKGAVRLDMNGDYNIYIDSRLSFEQQRRELMHELHHIKAKHHHRDLPVKEAERICSSQK